MTTPSPPETAVIATPAPDAIVRPAIRWIEVDEHFWTGGSSAGDVGTVEFVEGRFRVRDALGEIIGTSHSLGGAKTILVAGGQTDAPPAAELFGSDRLASLPIFATATTFLVLSAVAACGLAIQLFT